MSEVVVDPTVKVGFSFERKVPLPQKYASKTASAWVTAEVPAEADQSEVVAKIEALAAAVKVAVLTELGIESTFENGFVVEAAPAPAVSLTVEQAAAALEGAFAPDPSADAGLTVASSTGFDWGKVPADVVADFKANPQNYFDNRPKKAAGQYSPNAADLKRKSDEKSFWIKSKF